MMARGEFQHRGSRPYHGHCLHNDLPPRTRNFTLQGLFGAVIWIALWAVIITAVVSKDLRERFRSSRAANEAFVR